MAKYRVYLHYDAYSEKEVEADNAEEAIDIAFENLDTFDFEGEYTVDDVEELK